MRTAPQFALGDTQEIAKVPRGSAVNRAKSNQEC